MARVKISSTMVVHVNNAEMHATVAGRPFLELSGTSIQLVVADLMSWQCLMQCFRI
jgi:hypothetical protein